MRNNNAYSPQHESSMRFESASLNDSDRDVIPELVETSFPMNGSSPNRNMFYGFGVMGNESTDSLVSLADEEMMMARMMMGDVEE